MCPCLILESLCVCRVLAQQVPCRVDMSNDKVATFGRFSGILINSDMWCNPWMNIFMGNIHIRSLRRGHLQNIETILLTTGPLLPVPLANTIWKTFCLYVDHASNFVKDHARSNHQNVFIHDQNRMHNLCNQRGGRP